MRNVVRGNRGISFVVAAILALGISLPAWSQTVTPNTEGKFRLEPALSLGFGTKKIEVGKTTDNETISISGGGGVGVGVTAGYGLSESLDLDLTLGFQESNLSPDVANADGSFDRTFLLATLKYKIPVSGRFHVKLGGGIGFYDPGELDVDTPANLGGSRTVVKYDKATGYHVTSEWEIFITPGLSGIIGAKYYHVLYKEVSSTRNGAPVFFTDDKIRNLDGSGFDLILSVAKYF